LQQCHKAHIFHILKSTCFANFATVSHNTQFHVLKLILIKVCTSTILKDFHILESAIFAQHFHILKSAIFAQHFSYFEKCYSANIFHVLKIIYVEICISALQHYFI